MSSFNLSDWALRHKSFVLYLMIVSALAGLYSYYRLGREEDPPFTIRTMVVKTLWPGANTTDHRPHREEARGDPWPRFRAQLHQARRVGHFCQPEGFDSRK